MFYVVDNRALEGLTKGRGERKDEGRKTARSAHLAWAYPGIWPW